MSKVYIVDIEAVDTRYTKQWKEHLPEQMKKAGLDVEVISGGEVPQATTPGAFLNFAGTNHYKSQQLQQIADKFANGTVKNGDYFLYTDAWNPTVIQLKYMAELLGIKIRIGGMWHAGSYDPADFLGRLIGDAPWVRNAEQSMYYCYDDNFFATKFHLRMFRKNLWNWPDHLLDAEPGERTHIVGWPMEYLFNTLKSYNDLPKAKKIIFPHRLAPEKQLEIFKDLAASMPEYEWFVAQEHTLTKHEYHKHMGESKMMFSANLQETLGIGAFEAALTATYPFVPDRLSYTEMWPKCYPSSYTIDWANYQANKDKLMSDIRSIMNADVETVANMSMLWAEDVGSKFFNGKELYSIIKQHTSV